MQPDYNIEPHLQKQIDEGSSGLDIIHGHLKTLMHETEDQLAEALHGEGYEYLEGLLDGYAELYNLTYALSFAIAERDQI